MELAQDRVQWRAVVLAVLNLEGLLLEIVLFLKIEFKRPLSDALPTGSNLPLWCAYER
jgi:hypothetical protein